MSLSKMEWRKRLRQRLIFSPQDRMEKSAAICRAVAQHPAYLTAECVAVFDAMASEPALEELRTLAPRRFLFPRVEGAELRLVEVTDPATLQAPGFRGGYREPPAGQDLQPQLILVPGLAFTRGGLRMGRGGGFYDRLLARLPAEVRRIGVCFEAQIVDELPWEPHDMRVESVITECTHV